ncbi:MAG: serine hydrolase domain-containing protein, partial [Planctomycetota bacterium]
MKIPEKEIDEVFAEWDRPDSPGCALALIGEEGILYERGYGMANLEYDIPITPETIFHVASVSKQFTAMAVGMLAEEGKLSLDDDVRLHVPELHDFGEPLTVRHLIHHTSGLRDQWMLLVLAGWRMDDVITTEDAMDVVRRQRELNFKPGGEHLYCNSGYTLMAVVVERVSGLPFPEFCRERIFEPLAMKRSHFHDDHTRIVKNRAYSYVPREGNGFRHSVLSYATVGPTSLLTTVRDLAIWETNFTDGNVGGPSLLEGMQAPGT